MATTQQYSLRWNNYLRHLTYSLDNHRLNDDFVDVSLCVDGRKIKAHKVVLSSCSSYFKEIFKENPHPHPVIIFKFIKFEDLNSIVEFMYQGEVNVQQEALQSFLQTAELLAVQGLTAEEKEKPQLPVAPIISDQKLMKTIPSTIRAVNEQAVAAATATQTQTATQTIEIPTATLLQAAPPQTQQQQQLQTTQLQVVQQQVQQTQHHQQAQQQHHHHHVQTTQIQHIQVQHAPSQPPPQMTQVTHHHTQQQQQPTATQQHLTVTNAVTLPTANTVKKRKITFSDDDDNIYTTETVDYTVKDDQTIVKTAEMTFLRGTVKMDIPDYIVSEVDDRLSDGATPQTSQDATTAAGQNVTQYTSEYEILTESEIEEKYQADAENAEITIEMGRLLNATSGPSTTATSQTVLDDTGIAPVTTTTNTVKTLDVKNSNTNDPLALDSSETIVDATTDNTLICKFCKRRLQSMNALRRHVAARHMEIQSKEYECNLCSKNFKTKWSLSTHNSRFHRDMRVTKECIKIDFV